MAEVQLPIAAASGSFDGSKSLTSTLAPTPAAIAAAAASPSPLLPSPYAPMASLAHPVRPVRKAGGALTIVPPPKVQPIWLGSSLNNSESKIMVLDIKRIVREELRGLESVAAIEVFEAEVASLEAQQNYISAAECLEEALNLRRKLLGDSHRGFLEAVESYIINCNIWAMNQLGQGQYTIALELLKKAEFITEASHVPNFVHRVALRSCTFNNLCCYYRTRGKTNAAMQFAEKALRLEKHYKDSGSLAYVRLNYAVLLSMNERHEEAISHIEQAIGMLQDEERADFPALSPKSPAIMAPGAMKDPSSALVVAYFNMWVEMTRLNNSEAASVWIARAVDVAKFKLGDSHALTKKMVHHHLEQQQNVCAAPQKAHLPQVIMLPELDQITAPVIVRSTLKDLIHPPSTPGPGLAKKKKQMKAASVGPACQSARSRREEQLKENMYYRVLGARPELQHAISRPFFEERSKAEATPGYAGSAALQQLAHGTTPRLTSRAASPKRPMTQAATTVDVDLGPDASPEVPRRCRSVTPQPVYLSSLSQPPRPHTSAAELKSRDLFEGSPTRASKQELEAAYAYHAQLEKKRAENPEEDTQLADVERLRAIHKFSGSLARRKSKGLPIGSLEDQHRAASKIQAVFRGYSVWAWARKELASQTHKERSASRDSSAPAAPSDMKRRIAFRVIYAARRAFVEQRAAERIQKTWRGHVTRRDIRKQVELVAGSTATALQAFFRRCLVVYSSDRRDDAAITIQSCWRRRAGLVRTRKVRAFIVMLTRIGLGYATRRKLAKRHRAACDMQRLARGFIIRRRCLHRREGAVAFQKAFRGSLARRKGHYLLKCICRIQAAWRGFAQRRDSRFLVEAACLLQRQFRLHCKMKEKRLKDALARRISATWQGRKDRKVKPYHHSACLIQAHMRGFLARKRLPKLNPAALKIQACWRSSRVRYSQRVRLLLALVLQKATYRHLARRKLAKLEAAATACQRRIRGNRARRLLKYLHFQAKRLQSWWRGVRCRKQLVRRQAAALRIQTFVRCKVQLSSYKAQKKAVGLLRSAWLGYQKRCIHQRQVAAVATIARIARGFFVRLQKRRVLNASALKIQRSWRRHTARQWLRCRHRAATVIQCYVRRHQGRARYLRLKQNIAQPLQCLWRSFYLRRRFLRRRRASIVVQSVQQGRLARRHMLARRHAAIALQCCWRCAKVRSWHTSSERTAIRFQTLWRAYLCRQEFLAQREAATTIQRWVRRKRAIQTFTRRRESALRMRNAIKGFLVRQNYKEQRRQAIKIQAFFRGYHLRLRLGKASALICMLTGRWFYKKQVRSIHHLQCVFRSARAISNLRARRQASLKLQALLRGLVVRRLIVKQHRMATFIQSWWRGRKQRRAFLAKKHCQERIARGYRLARAQRLMSREVLYRARLITRLAKGSAARMTVARMHRAAICIQRHARGVLIRQVARRQRQAVRIQSRWRQLEAVRCVEEMRAVAVVEEERAQEQAKEDHERKLNECATKIQSHVRRMLKAKIAYPKLKSSTLIIQSWWRSRRLVRLHRRQEKAAIVIQAKTRGASARHRVSTVRKAVLPIQRVFRAYLIARDENKRTFNDYAEKTAAAIVIQTKWRQHSLMWKHMRRRVAAVRIQATIRRLLQRRIYLQKCRAVSTIQVSLFQPYLHMKKLRHRRECLVKVQSFARLVLAKKKAGEIRAATAIVQAAGRSYHCRHWYLVKRYRAAVRLQAFWKMYRQKVKIHPTRVAALRRIQSMCRRFAFLLVQKSKLRAARRIQSFVRRRRSLRRMQRLRWLAICLQRIWRARRGRSIHWVAFRRLCLIPGYARGHLERKRLFVAREHAAVTIQRVVRGHQSRKRLQKRHQAATILQANWRPVAGSRAWRRKLAAIRTIQGAFFAWTHRRQLAKLRKPNSAARTLLPMKPPPQASESATAITRRYRWHAARMMVFKMQDSAVVISSRYRGHFVRKRFEAQKEAALILQRQARMWLAIRRRERRARSVTKIQPALNAAYHQRQLEENLEKILFAQGYIKSWFSVRKLAILRKTAIEIQRMVKGIRAWRQYQIKLKAALKLSSAARGMIVRRSLRRQNKSAAKIQSVWRRFLVVSGVKELNRRALRIQKAYKCYRCYSRFQCVRAAGERLVSSVIMYRQQRLFRKKTAAVTTIASAWRQRRFQRAVESINEAAIRLQRWWRDLSTSCEYRHFVAEILATSKVLQNIYLSAHATRLQRWFRVQRQRPFEFYRCRAAVIKLQANIRRHQAQELVNLMKATLGVHVNYHLSETVALEKDSLGKLSKHSSLPSDATEFTGPTCQILVTQSLSRYQKFRLVEASVGKIQPYWRWYRVWKAVCLVQRRYRGHLARVHLARHIAAATRIQAAVRSRNVVRNLGPRRLAAAQLAKEQRRRAYLWGDSSKRTSRMSGLSASGGSAVSKKLSYR